MFLDGENATGVTAAGTSAEAAKTAETVNAAGAAGELAAAPPAEAQETSVSPQRGRVVEVIADDSTVLTTDPLAMPVTYGQIRSIVIGVLESPAGHAVLVKLVENFVGQWLFANPPTIGGGEMEKLIDQAGNIANDSVQAMSTQIEIAFDRKLDAAKADILAHLTPLITAIVAGKTPPAIATEHAPAVPATPKDLRVEDPVKVWADPQHKTFREGEIVAIHEDAHAFDVKLDDGSVTKVPADGLEYDDRR